MGAHVLIGFAEALPTAEVIFSLANAGHTVSVFTRKQTNSPLFTHLPLINTFRVTAPEDSYADAIVDVRAIFAADTPPDVILALDDPALLVVNEAFDTAPRAPLIANATGAPAQVALDKSQQVLHANSAGFSVPQTIVVRAPSDLAGVKTFPCIAKPALAVGVEDGKLAKGKAEYFSDAEAVTAFRASLADDMLPLLIQPLIEGQGEGVFGIMTDAGVLNWSGHKRLRMMNPHGSGSSACQTLQPDEKLRHICEDFLTRINWRGPFMIELLRAVDGTPYFMELNGRMWGSMALARRAGYEYPAWSVARAIDPEFHPPVVTPPNPPLVLRHLGRELAHLLFVLRGPKTAFHKSAWPKLGPAVLNVLKPSRGKEFYNYDPAHRWYFMRDAYDVVSGTVFKNRG